MQDKIIQLISDIQAGNHKALARAITIVENNLAGHEQILQSLNNNNAAQVIGITGPPGAGKSTLVNALIKYWVQQGKKVAVIAVDPSSPFNYGSLLGDRIRMSSFYNNEQVYIRSLATRGALGGLNPKIIEITDVVKQAPFDVILVETVGVGQSEVEIAGLADCSIVTLVPEAGDEVQTLKAGIMEIADIFVINKADRDTADTLYANLRIMVHQKAGANAEEIPVLKTIATKDEGVQELAQAITKYFEHNAGFNEKKLHLLTEKCWQLIQASRMQDVNKGLLSKELADNMNKDDFNLYNYVKKYTS